MHITKVAIRNFRQYRDQVLDLTRPNSDMAILVGKNGAGKTNLLNSIVWCLYGEEKYSTKSDRSSPLVNQGALDASDEGAILPCSVTVDIRFNDETVATIERTISFRKIKGRALPLQKSQVTVSKLTSLEKGYEPVQKPEQWIDRYLPLRLQSYFLFDGERLDTFFREAEAEKIKSAVLEIAQIDLLEKMRERLAKIASKLHSEAAKSSGQLDIALLGGRADVASKRLEELEARRTEKKAEIEAFEALRLRLESQHGDIKEIHTLVERRRELELARSDAEQKAGEAQKELTKWSARAGLSALFAGQLRLLESELDAARVERRLPPPVQPAVLKELLEQHSCICGTELAPGSHAHSEIEELLKKYDRIGQVGELLLDIEGGVRDHAVFLSHAGGHAVSLLQHLQDWRMRADAADVELQALAKRLIGNDDETVVRIERELGRAKEDLSRAQQEEHRLAYEADSARDELSAIEKEIARAVASDERAVGLLRRAKFAAECAAVAESIYVSMTTEVREQVAATLERYFLEMIWKKDWFASVTIDEDYRVSVMNTRGYEVLPNLSAGERECLALAFALSLSEVSDYELPMIIDTPMTRLSADVQESMAQVLCDATASSGGSPAHQLIMLMTEVEYRDQVARVLAQREPRVFRIEFDQTAAESEIKEDQ